MPHLSAPLFRAFMARLFRADLIAHAKEIEVNETTWRFGCEIKQSEAIAHEVRQGVGHLQDGTDLRPCPAVQAVVEIGLVRTVPEVTVDLDIHGGLRQRNALDLNGLTGLISSAALIGLIRRDTDHND